MFSSMHSHSRHATAWSRELLSERPAPFDLPKVAANDPAGFKPQAGKSRRGKPDWTDGLSTRTANALRAHGLCSREDVQALSARALKRIPNLGRRSLEDLGQWLHQGPAGGGRSTFRPKKLS